MHVEWLLILALLLLAGLPFARVLLRRPLVLVGVAALLAGVGTLEWRSFQSHTLARMQDFDRLAADLPHLERRDEYVSSNSCRTCHPSEHASWHRTYHRTMTQIAVPENVVGAFDGTVVSSAGLDYRVFRKGDEFWADMPDPDIMMYVVQGGRRMALTDVPRVERRVVMTTGSHHYQTYWVGSERYDRLLQTLPLVYLIKDRRWIPREAAFLETAAEPRMITQWNHACIRCHSTGGVPGLDRKTGMLDTRVGELGISCEACHGPGAEHIRLNQDPFRRYRLHLTGKSDPSIVNPAKLDHRKSSQVCGQCHGVYIMRDEYAMAYAYEGTQYRPGEDLHRARYYIQHPRSNDSAERVADRQNNEKFFAERWWDDDTILAAGREFTAMAVSGCYQRGKISCLHCHSMHDSDPVDQLKPGMRGSAACTQCHDRPEYTTDVSRHTHHPSDSSGSNCLNCHMPHTSYALLGGIRNHQIASPDLSRSARYGVPNACNLCHLDQTLAWAQEHMGTWYGHESLPLSPEHKTVSAALLWLLKGHAAQRAIAAWHVGWAPAWEASGSDWLAPFQARLLADPYGVVRYVAEHNLRKLPGFGDFRYNFLADAPELNRRVDEVVARWQATRPEERSRTGEHLLIDAQGNVMEARVQALLRQRDNRPMAIKE